MKAISKTTPATLEANQILEQSETVSGDLYKVLSELQMTKYYRLDNPSRDYIVVGWYLSPWEVRISVINREQKRTQMALSRVDSRWKG
jgi:hypothetical protein